MARHPQVTAGRLEDIVKDPAVFLLEYRDGLRAALVSLNGLVVGHGFAAHGPARAEPWSTFFVEGGPPYAPEEGGDRPLPNFDGLAFAIEELMLTKRAPWPMERTVRPADRMAESADLGGQEIRVAFAPGGPKAAGA